MKKRSRKIRRAATRERVLKKLVRSVHQQHDAAVRVQRQAQDLTDDGYPPGHPLRTLCLLLSGDAGRAQFAYEQTQTFLQKERK
jgi:hypothetical protein